jgi:tRNA(fMet)-specific endonuclease VapC
MLDTSVVILLRDGDPAAVERLARSPATLLLSVVSLVELEGGVHRDPSQTATRRERLNAVLLNVQVLPFTEEIVAIYGELIGRIGFSRGQIIDRMLAAHALHASAALATSNVRHFDSIPQLRVEDWTSSSRT